MRARRGRFAPALLASGLLFLLCLAAAAVGAQPAAGDESAAAPDTTAPPPPPEATPAPAESLTVAEMSFGLGYDYESKAPVDVADTFPAGTERVYCYTRVVGASEPTEIVHAWYREGQTMAKVPLRIGSPDWRTVSSKLIVPAAPGRWEVKVLGPDGAVLDSGSFTIE